MKVNLMNLSFYIVFIMSILTVFIFACLNSENRINNDYVQIQLSNGDTLWEVSEKFASQHGLDTYEFIKWVEDKNNINGNRLLTGQILYIPVKKEHIQDSLLLLADGS
jgi:hypothetical protein